jgi:hypothetical protein
MTAATKEGMEQKPMVLSAVQRTDSGLMLNGFSKITCSWDLDISFKYYKYSKIWYHSHKIKCHA